jgi:hypothetical protein
MSTTRPGQSFRRATGLVGSTGWGLWVAVLGVVLLRAPRPAGPPLPLSEVSAPAATSTRGSAPAGQRS